MIKMFKCGICGKEFNTVEERMEHERSCVAVHKEAERQHKLEVQKAESERKKEMAKADSERIQNECKQLIKDVKHHRNTYGENVKFDMDKMENIGSPLYLYMLDPFWEFEHIF